jgi:hypothetical protein
LLPGDIVLADRGFDIQDSVGLHCAEVKIPAFIRGKKQLSPLEIEQTRKIAHTRIHVERVIGLVRNKHTILQNTIPTTTPSFRKEGHSSLGCYAYLKCYCVVVLVVRPCFRAC